MSHTNIVIAHHIYDHCYNISSSKFMIVDKHQNISLMIIYDKRKKIYIMIHLTTIVIVYDKCHNFISRGNITVYHHDNNC